MRKTFLANLQYFFVSLQSFQEIKTILAILIAVFAILYFFGAEITPILFGFFFAYSLVGMCELLERFKIPRTIASLICVLFFAICCILLLSYVPLLITELGEISALLSNVEKKIISLLQWFNTFLPEHYHVNTDFSNQADVPLFDWNQLLGDTLILAQDTVALLVYLFVIPIFVFFLLKDRKILVNNINSVFTPHRVTKKFLVALNSDFALYLRGKLIEGAIVAIFCGALFFTFSLPYAFSLALLCGLSVFIPFVGIVLVSIPVILVASLSFNSQSDIAYVLIGYSIIMLLDAQLLVPLLLADVVKLNPVYIIIALLFFGGLWGFWGVFFAIPLASLIKQFILISFEYLQENNQEHQPPDPNIVADNAKST